MKRDFLQTKQSARDYSNITANDSTHTEISTVELKTTNCKFSSVYLKKILAIFLHLFSSIVDNSQFLDTIPKNFVDAQHEKRKSQIFWQNNGFPFGR